MTIPYALPSLTTSPTPLAAPLPLGGFRFTCPTTCAWLVEVPVVVVPVVPVVAVLDVPAGVDATVEEECLGLDPPLSSDTRTTTTATTTIAPTPRMIAPPRRELGRSESRGVRRPGERGSDSCSRGLRWRGSVAAGRAAPSGISGSGAAASGSGSAATARGPGRAGGGVAGR